MREVKWATAIPLVGGSAIGCWNATGVKPEYHLSYSAFEKNEKPLENYWPEVPRIVLDEGQSAPDKKVDFINSVCPCAGLSQLSTSKSKEVRDKSNKWMFETADVVLGKIRPRVFWGENAPALFTNMGSWVREALIEKAQEFGYSFSLYKTTTSKHGIPQKRTRTFYFFWDSEFCPIMNYYDRPRKSLPDYLSEISPLAPNQDEFVRKNSLTEESFAYQYVLQKLNISHEDFVKSNDGGSTHSFHTFVVENNMIEDCIKWIEKNHGVCKESIRLKKIKIKIDDGKRFMDGSPAYHYDCSNALVGRNLTGMIHPVKNRFLSVREVMHLMGMPEDFNFSLSNGNSLNFLAQNVPSCTSRDMTLEVLKYLRGELEFSDKSYLKQDNLKGRIIK